MKKILLLIPFITLSVGLSFSQNTTNNPVTINFQVLSKDGNNFILSPEILINMLMTYHRTDSSPVYSEKFSKSTDILGNVNLEVGSGTEASPPELTNEMLKDIEYASYAADIFNLGGPTHIEGKLNFNPVPTATESYFAQEAKNAQQLGGNTFNSNPVTFDELISTDPNFQSGLLTLSGDAFNSIQPFLLKDVLVKEPTLYKAGNITDDMFRIKDALDKSLGISDNKVLETDSKILLCSGHLQNRFYNVLGVVAKPESSPHVLHNTAAIYANNQATEGSAGVNAKAGTWALYGSAPNGALGVSSSGSNGAGTWGALAQAPDAGGFKYAVLGNSGGFTGAWAGAFFGSGFYTGTWAVSSDARLKTEIRSQSNALNKVMQLRPADYNYRQDTPWNLPQGLHHGFIAQEVEEILPELVSDITLPNSLDTQDMHKSGTSQYKAINYIEIISILTQAMQELNTKMDTQAKEIEALKKEVKALTGKK